MKHRLKLLALAVAAASLAGAATGGSSPEASKPQLIQISKPVKAAQQCAPQDMRQCYATCPTTSYEAYEACVAWCDSLPPCED